MKLRMKNTSSRVLAGVMAIMLVVGMIQVNLLLSVSAATIPDYMVTLEESICGSNTLVTLTNSDDPVDTDTQPAVNGTAAFENFVDEDNTYILSITGMIGYEDYTTPSPFIPESNGYLIYIGDLTEMTKVSVSGQVNNENGQPYTDAARVIYSGYTSGTVDISGDGSFSFEIYAGQDYTMSLQAENEKYETYPLGNVNASSAYDFGAVQLVVKTFSVTTNAGENGIITDSDTVLYGDDKNIVVTADTGYRIATLTVNSNPISAAVGEQTYTYSLTNITSSHIVNATFVRKTYEITISFNQDGTVTDGSLNSVTTGGKITANEGENPGFIATANPNYHIGSVVIDSVGKTDGTFDNDQIIYSYTFNEIGSNHTVTILFEINTFDIEIDIVNSNNGTVTYDGSSAPASINVDYGSTPSFIITPHAGYTFTLKLNDTVVLENISGDTGPFTYTFDSVIADQDMEVIFNQIAVTTGDENDYYTLVFSKPAFRTEETETVKTYFLPNDAYATLSPKSYDGIKYNNLSYSSSNTINSTVVIQTIYVANEWSFFLFSGWNNEKQVQLEKSIHIVIDKDKPVVVNIPAMEWSKNDVTVSGTVTDFNTASDPSSGLSRIVWSKNTTLTDAAVLSEAVNTVPIANNEYSFTITEEQNSETYYVYAVDNAGNVSDAKTVVVRIDKTNPAITEFTFNKKADSTTEKVINFLTFGTFFKEAIEVTVSAEDTGISSGLNRITLYNGNGTEVESKIVSGSAATATFTLSLADFSNNEISASVSDIAGNVSDVKKPTEVTSNANHDLVMLETTLPTIQITPDNETYADGQDKWYEGNAGFVIQVGDEHSGIHSVVIKVNNLSIATDKDGQNINADFSLTKTTTKTFVVNTDQNSVDGENVIEVIVTDNAGNEYSTSTKIFKDTTNPDIVGFEITKANSDPLSKTLNFLTFGVFFNEKVLITVTADDDMAASSGLKTITLYADGEAIAGSPKTVTGNIAVFEIPVEEITNNTKLFDKTLSAVATDNVGNITGKNAENPNGIPVLPTTVNSDIKDSGLMIETINPTIVITPASPVYTDNDSKAWYPTDVAFDIIAGDIDSGIRSVAISINNQTINTDKNSKAINANFYESETHQETFLVNTDQGTRAADGSYTIDITVIDNAGNQYADSIVIYKDIDNPYVTEFVFSATGHQEADGENTTVEVTDYGFYFIEDTTVTISAEDDAPTSGIKSITYYTVDINAGKSSEITANVTNDEISFIVPANFKGQIYAKATDNVNNTPEDFVNPNSAIVESPEKHLEETHIAFDKNQTAYTDNNDLELYAEDTNVLLTVTDTYSGLRKVEWSVTAPYDTENDQSGSFEITNDRSYVSGGDTDGWNQTQTDRNLVTEMTKTITVNHNSNAIKLWVKITDRAGNTSEDEITFSIDKTIPTIEVTYDNNTPDGEFTDFYNADRTATIIITERNFRADDVVIQITNTDGVLPAVSTWATIADSSDPDQTTHTATIHYSADGDYTFDISYKDNSENAAAAFTQHTFTLDKTIPIISVSYDNNTALNGNYFAADRTATITITEHNFETSRIQITGVATDDGIAATFPVASAWASNGDVHTATIHYATDAKYSFDIAYKDKAGNDTADYAQEEFYVDKTAPTLVVSGVADKSANNGDVIPVISYTDTNFNRNNVTITLAGANRGTVSPAGGYADQHNGQVYTFENFEKVKEVDDLYTLTATLTDFAGNQTTQTITFSANRFGSVYTFDDLLQAIAGKYVKEEVDVVLTETNVDSLRYDTIKVKLTFNGTPKDLIEGTDYTVAETGGNGQWSQYTYTVNKSLFSSDGRYTVALYSEDEAGNINENIDESKEAEISFGIDKTAPVVVAIDLENGKQYAVESKTANISIKDNLVLDGVTVYLNDQKVDTTVDGENYSFNIASSNSKQSVKIVAVDAAGNEFTLDITDFLVTTNLFYRWYNNTPLFVGSLVGVGVIAIALAAFVIFSRKKKRT